MIPLLECIKGHVYKIKSRNLNIGVFDGKSGFIGIRTKFSSQYLFTEYHRDNGPPFGTVSPIEDIGVIPSDIPISENLGTIESKTEKLVFFDKPVQDGGKGWCYQDTGEPINHNNIYSKGNIELFDYLKQIEKELSK